MSEILAGALPTMREVCPDLQARAYLSWAAISPASTVVRSAADSTLSASARLGAGAFGAFLATRERLRERLSDMLAVSKDRIGFCQSTSAGIVHLAWGIDFAPRDRIVLFDGEFPANVLPWQEVAAFRDLDIVFLRASDFQDSHEVGLARLEEILKTGVRLVAVSAVQFQTGLRMPVERMAELAHRYGAEIAVDAIQALGVVPFTVGSIDYLACGSHKWLMGLDGAGFVYVSPQARSFRPRLGGWLGVEEPVRFLFEGDGHLRYDRPWRTDISSIEQGNQSSVSLCALEASVELLTSVGFDRIFGHVQSYHDLLEPQLLELGFRSLRTSFHEGRSGSLCTKPPPGVDVIAVAQRLHQEGIVVSTPDGYLRFAPHAWNNLSEIADVVSVLQHCCQ